MYYRTLIIAHFSDIIKAVMKYFKKGVRWLWELRKE